VYGTLDGVVGSNTVVVDSTVQLAVNGPVIFNNMFINGARVSSFGNIDPYNYIMLQQY